MNLMDNEFPFNLEECECIKSLCTNSVSKMESNLITEGSHGYIELKSLIGKIDGYIKLIEANQEDKFKNRF